MRARCGRMNSPLVLNTRSTEAEVAGEQKTWECMQDFKCWVSPDYGPHSFRFFFTVHRCKTMVLDISHAMLDNSILENFRGLELPRTRTRTRTWAPRTRTRTWKLVLEDPRGQELSSRTTILLITSVVSKYWLKITIFLYVSYLEMIPSPFRNIDQFYAIRNYMFSRSVPDKQTDWLTDGRNSHINIARAIKRQTDCFNKY